MTRSLAFIALSSASLGDISDAIRHLYSPIRQCPYGRSEFHQVRSSACYHMDLTLSYLPSPDIFDGRNCGGHTYCVGLASYSSDILETCHVKAPA